MIIDLLIVLVGGKHLEHKLWGEKKSAPVGSDPFSLVIMAKVDNSKKKCPFLDVQALFFIYIYIFLKKN